jgi:hypothetical protein
VIYLGPAPTSEFSIDFSLHVHVASKGYSGVLDAGVREQILADFQPRFLEYRIRNRSAVSASTFDLAEMQSETRVTAKILGACIVNAPEIQIGIRALLRAREDQIREMRFTDHSSVIVDVLFALCHGQKQHAVRVKEIAEAAEVTLKGRGEPERLEPRRVGAILDALGLPRKRNSDGFRILLGPEIQRRIHLLARDYQIESVPADTAACAVCTEILENIADPKETGTCTGQSGS